MTPTLVVSAWWGAAVLWVLVLGLSLALAAVESLNRVALRRLGSNGNGNSSFLETLRDPLSEHRMATLLLRQLAMLAIAVLVTWAAHAMGVVKAAAFGIGLTALLTVLVVDVLIARPLALWEPRGVLRATRWLMVAARALLYPIVVPLHVVYARLDRAQGLIDDPVEDADEEVEALIEVGEREGLLEAAEGRMMRGIVDLDETRVREIMTPRIDIESLPEDSTVAEARRKLIEAGHSRLPVYRETIDNVVGALHARDLFQAWEAGQDGESVRGYLRPVIHVPEHLSAAELLAEMRMKTKLALVVDEYGGVSGLVTLEDLLEEIVGEIRDEHEQEEQDDIRRDADGSYVIQALTHVDGLKELFGIEIGEREYDTVGGLVVAAFARVPEVGESIEVNGLHIEVLEAEKRRILSVRIARCDAAVEDDVTDGAA